MGDEYLPAARIVTVMQDDQGNLQILTDDDVSKFEALGMLRIAAKVQEEAVMFEVEMIEEDPD